MSCCCTIQSLVHLVYMHGSCGCGWGGGGGGWYVHGLVVCAWVLHGWWCVHGSYRGGGACMGPRGWWCVHGSYSTCMGHTGVVYGGPGGHLPHLASCILHLASCIPRHLHLASCILHHLLSHLASRIQRTASPTLSHLTSRIRHSASCDTLYLI